MNQLELGKGVVMALPPMLLVQLLSQSYQQAGSAIGS